MTTTRETGMCRPRLTTVVVAVASVTKDQVLRIRLAFAWNLSHRVAARDLEEAVYSCRSLLDSISSLAYSLHRSSGERPVGSFHRTHAMHSGLSRDRT